MEGDSSFKREDSKPNPMMNNIKQHVSPSFMPPAFQHAQYPQYYQAYPGMSMGSPSFPFYAHPPKPKRQLNKFTIFEKLQAIERVNCGETKAHVARSINVAESTLRGWFKNGDKLRTLYETEELPMQQSCSKSNPGDFSAMYNVPGKIIKKEGESSFTEPSPSHMLQAKSFNNYNFSWLEFYRNFENLPLQYFDSTFVSSRVEEGPELGKRFLRWMEDRMGRGDRNLNIHMGHLEAFRSLLGDIFRGHTVGHTVGHPQERKHIVGDDNEVTMEEKPKPVERKHIVGDDDVKDEPKSIGNTDDDDDDDEEGDEEM